ncbi:MAG TPA: hypothetical protein DHM37_00785, partial [Candidatus Cloacimonas sp.]|nr:hypothetical protein [Candidatus Cloacimonas sp.]
MEKFKFRYFFIYLFFLTLIAFLLFPSLLFHNYKHVSYDIEQIDMCSGFTVLPNHWDYGLFFIYDNMDQNRVLAQMYNNKTHNIQYKEFTGKNLNSTISTRATCIYDEQW